MVETKILIVVDMQNDFITGVFGTEEAQVIVPKVAEKIKSYPENDYIYATQDTHFNAYYSDTKEANLPIHCEIESKGYLIHDDVQAELEARVSEGLDVEYISKFTFGSSELASKINDLCSQILSSNLEVGVKPQNINFKIELVGLCTDICVISNALILKAIAPYADIVVDASCCAGTTLENHNKALDIMTLNGIDVINRD